MGNGAAPSCAHYARRTSRVRLTLTPSCSLTPTPLSAIRLAPPPSAALQLQTHYDNSAGTPGRVDSSAVRVYYTDPRPVDIGVMQAMPRAQTI